MFEPVSAHRARGGYLVFGTWAAITAVALALRPDPAGHGTHQQLGLAPCPSVVFLDRPCPGCGLTTSWTAFVHGDLATSLHAHLLGPLTYVLFTLLAIGSLVAARRSQRFVTDGVGQTRFLAAFAIVFFGYAFYRFSTVSHYATAGEDALRKGVIETVTSR